MNEVPVVARLWVPEDLTEEFSSLANLLGCQRAALTESFEHLLMLEKVVGAMEFTADEVEKRNAPLS